MEHGAGQQRVGCSDGVLGLLRSPTMSCQMQIVANVELRTDMIVCDQIVNLWILYFTYLRSSFTL